METGEDIDGGAPEHDQNKLPPAPPKQLLLLVNLEGCEASAYCADTGEPWLDNVDGDDVDGEAIKSSDGGNRFGTESCSLWPGKCAVAKIATAAAQPIDPLNC